MDTHTNVSSGELLRAVNGFQHTPRDMTTDATVEDEIAGKPEPFSTPMIGVNAAARLSDRTASSTDPLIRHLASNSGDSHFRGNSKLSSEPFSSPLSSGGSELKSSLTDGPDVQPELHHIDSARTLHRVNGDSSLGLPTLTTAAPQIPSAAFPVSSLSTAHATESAQGLMVPAESPGTLIPPGADVTGSGIGDDRAPAPAPIAPQDDPKYVQDFQQTALVPIKTPPAYRRPLKGSWLWCASCTNIDAVDDPAVAAPAARMAPLMIEDGDTTAQPALADDRPREEVRPRRLKRCYGATARMIRHVSLVAAATVLIGIGCAVGTFFLLNSKDQSFLDQQFNRLCLERLAALRGETNLLLADVRSALALHVVSGFQNDDKLTLWANVTGAGASNFPFTLFAFARFLRDADRAAYETDPANYTKGFGLWELRFHPNNSFYRLPSPQDDWYLPLEYSTTPAFRNVAEGWNLRYYQNQGDIVKQVLESGEPAIAPPTRTALTGLYLSNVVMPFYGQGVSKAPSSFEERFQTIQGIFYASFQYSALLNASLARLQRVPMRLSLHTPNEQLVVASAQVGNDSSTEYTKQFVINIGTFPYTMKFSAGKEYAKMVLPRIFSSSSVLYSDSIFLAAIVFLAFFLISAIFQQRHQHARGTLLEVEKEVAARTAELQRAVADKEELVQRMDACKKEAEDANAAKGDFLAYLCHELRNPLHVIVGFTELRVHGEVGEPEYLSCVQSTASLMHDIVNDVLDLSKIDRGHMEFECVPFNLHKLVQDVVKSINLKDSKTKSGNEKPKDITLYRRIAKDVPEIVFGDPTRLRQVLVNLLSNSVKFTQIGYVSCVVQLASPDPASSASREMTPSPDGLPIPHRPIGALSEAMSSSHPATNSPVKAQASAGDNEAVGNPRGSIDIDLPVSMQAGSAQFDAAHSSGPISLQPPQRDRSDRRPRAVSEREDVRTAPDVVIPVTLPPGGIAEAPNKPAVNPSEVAAALNKRPHGSIPNVTVGDGISPQLGVRSMLQSPASASTSHGVTPMPKVRSIATPAGQSTAVPGAASSASSASAPTPLLGPLGFPRMTSHQSSALSTVSSVTIPQAASVSSAALSQAGHDQKQSQVTAHASQNDLNMELLEQTHEICTRTIEFIVEDTGIGIPKTALPTLFQPYTQAKLSVARTHGGTGLGLSIVSRIVAKMRGSVHVESEEGTGSRFTVRVELKCPVNDAPPHDPAVVQSPSGDIVPSESVAILRNTDAVNAATRPSSRIVSASTPRLEMLREHDPEYTPRTDRNVEPELTQLKHQRGRLASPHPGLNDHQLGISDEPLAVASSHTPTTPPGSGTGSRSMNGSGSLDAVPLTLEASTGAHSAMTGADSGRSLTGSLDGPAEMQLGQFVRKPVAASAVSSSAPRYGLGALPLTALGDPTHSMANPLRHDSLRSNDSGGLGQAVQHSGDVHGMNTAESGSHVEPADAAGLFVDSERHATDSSGDDHDTDRSSHSHSDKRGVIEVRGVTEEAPHSTRDTLHVPASRTREFSHSRSASAYAHTTSPSTPPHQPHEPSTASRAVNPISGAQRASVRAGGQTAPNEDTAVSDRNVQYHANASGGDSMITNSSSRSPDPDQQPQHAYTYADSYQSKRRGAAGKSASAGLALSTAESKQSDAASAVNGGPRHMVPSSSSGSQSSAVGVGSTSSMAASTSTSLRDQAAAPPTRVLVVEDSDINQKLIVRLLSSLGYSADVASNGVEAITKVREYSVRNGKTYPIILMDLNMPVMTGWEATTQLRQLGYTMPIIALTANALDESKKHCMAVGFTSFLTKPFKKADLQALLPPSARPAAAAAGAGATATENPKPNSR